MSSGIEIQRVVDEPALGRAAAGLFVRLARQRIADAGRFAVVLADAATMRPLAAALATTPRVDGVDWGRVDVVVRGEPVPAVESGPIANANVRRVDANAAVAPALDLVLRGVDPVDDGFVNGARCVAYLAAGADESARLAEMLEGSSPADGPEHGRFIGLVDRAAAADLSGVTARTVRLSPSILAADFARLGEQVATAERYGADRVHVDVMDGHFVPNISIGTVVVESLRRATSLPLETHLMITDPKRYAEAFAVAGSDRILFHQEVCDDSIALADQIRGLGASPGIVINPETAVDTIAHVIPHVDLVLIMTVHPGFGGQSFIDDTRPKIAAVRELIDRDNPTCDLEVDGGIGAGTAARAVDAGARVLVAGSAIFGHDAGIEEATKRIMDAAREGVPCGSR